MLAAQHVVVTKTWVADWDHMTECIEQAISKFYEAGLPPVSDSVLESIAPMVAPEGSIEAKILELLEQRVRPYVQQDGGDVAFDNFDPADGTLYLRLQGSCSGCSQSHATLQEGVKNLMDHYIPEVKQIVGLNENEEEDLPRPGR